ncbi:MAG: sulfotransferase domain-containing protein [Actinomycetota bacterium]|nr:sulfotransferase domain-containing protein [Actinomycetota bacterium]
MLVSYPRSGNTWTRFVLANLMSATPADFVNLEERVPDIYVSSALHIRRLPPPRVIKSHEPYTPSYGRVVYLVRDPRDVAASYLRFLHRAGAQDSRVTLEAFTIPFLNGQGNWDSFGSWGDHVSGWLSRQVDDDFLLVRYEDLLVDTVREIDRVARFCGILTDARSIASAVASSSPERMRAFEQSQAKISKSLHFRESPIPFVGPAREGAGRALMDADTLAGFESTLGRIMRSLGYA